MGIKKIAHEFKSKVSQSRLFKALITHPQEVLPKCTESIKSIEIVEGSDVSDGCVIKATLADGIKYVKHRIDSIKHDEFECEYTLIEGDVLGDKLEKVRHNMKFVATEDGGGCVIKVESHYHTKGDIELNHDDIKAGEEHALTLYKACETYLIANPKVFA
ncbi:hypothetical protein OROGR_015724 [Orobanche gracilis]